MLSTEPLALSLGRVCVDRRIGRAGLPEATDEPIPLEGVIQQLQARKQGLADALFEGTGQGPLGLTGEKIDALFGPARTDSPTGP